MGNLKNRKYELTDETIKFKGITLYRIKALRDFSDVKTGDLGGFIKSEYNLSHDGDCWIYDNAKVYDDAQVYDDAKVYDDAQVYWKAQVYDNAQVYGDAEVYWMARVYGAAKVYDEAKVYDAAKVYGAAKVYCEAKVYGMSEVYDNAKVYGRAEVYWMAKVYGAARICDNARVYGDAKVYGRAEVYNVSKVYNDAKIFGHATVCGDARVYDKAIISENQAVSTGACKKDLSKDLKESIRCQTGLLVINNEVIAYKQVKKDLSSFWDGTFVYKVGEYAEVTDYDKSNKSCASGLHFSNANYWNKNKDIAESTFLVAKINLDDIITVQEGKIRCKKAFIIGTYDID